MYYVKLDNIRRTFLLRCSNLNTMLNIPTEYINIILYEYI